MFQSCDIVSGELLECVLPRLDAIAQLPQDSDTPTLLQYDVHIDSWNMSLGSLTPDDLEYEPIRVYREPNIIGLDNGQEVLQYTGVDMEVIIQVLIRSKMSVLMLTEYRCTLYISVLLCQFMLYF